MGTKTQPKPQKTAAVTYAIHESEDACKMQTVKLKGRITEDNALECVGSYEDSGSNVWELGRPKFHHMMTDAMSDKFKVIVVTNATSISRNTDQMRSFVQLFKDKSISVIFTEIGRRD